MPDHIWSTKISYWTGPGNRWEGDGVKEYRYKVLTMGIDTRTDLLEDSLNALLAYRSVPGERVVSVWFTRDGLIQVLFERVATLEELTLDTKPN
jgi:hypothetical protein